MLACKLTTQWQGHAKLLKQLIVRQLSVGATQQQVLEHLHEAKEEVRTDEEWLNAKDYEQLPGPSTLGMIAEFMPGGKLQNSNLVEMNKFFRDNYGDIFRLKGIMGKPDVVCTYNPADFETTYRNEGIWPVRIGLQSLQYYRSEKRPDVYHGICGLVTEQGKSWADIRNKVNPVLMKVQNVRRYLPQIDSLSEEFLKIIEKSREPNSNLLEINFQDTLKTFAFEAVSLIALNTRLGLLAGKKDAKAERLVVAMTDFFQYSYEYDVAPSFWKYIETPGFKRLLKTYDEITDVTINYIEEAIRKFEAEGNKEAISVLEKLCRIDKKIAVVMATDMLMAGIDTTSSTFITTLYLIAKHPEKQEALRRELKQIMPTKDTPLTEENTKQMPYLRATLKETLRITPITPSNFRVSVKDLVLSGYKIPKGTGVVMDCMALSNTDQYFPRSQEFLPERWIKTGESACPAAKNSNPFVYLPFGFGPRTCIGKRIAEMEIETLLAKLLRKYRVSWMGEGDMKYTSNIILVPTGDIKFKFEPVEN